jgi:hypothetical protein
LEGACWGPCVVARQRQQLKRRGSNGDGAEPCYLRRGERAGAEGTLVVVRQGLREQWRWWWADSLRDC